MGIKRINSKHIALATPNNDMSNETRTHCFYLYDYIAFCSHIAITPLVWLKMLKIQLSEPTSSAFRFAIKSRFCNSSGLKASTWGVTSLTSSFTSGSTGGNFFFS